MTQTAISVVQLHATKCQLYPPLSLAGKLLGYTPSSYLCANCLSKYLSALVLTFWEQDTSPKWLYQNFYGWYLKVWKRQQGDWLCVCLGHQLISIWIFYFWKLTLLYSSTILISGVFVHTYKWLKIAPPSKYSLQKVLCPETSFNLMPPSTQIKSPFSKYLILWKSQHLKWFRAKSMPWSEVRDRRAKLSLRSLWYKLNLSLKCLNFLHPGPLSQSALPSVI